jgi:NAD(P)H-flavin reductase
MSALAEPALVASELMPRRFRVGTVEHETPDTVTLTLVPVDGEPMYVRPGQFTMIYAFGVGEIPVSVSGYGEPLVQTVRAVGAVSSAICAVHPGSELGVRGPYGNHWPVEEAERGDLLIVAGGIGLAPLHGALHAVLAHRDRYREVILLYGARTPFDLLYRSELQVLAGNDDLQLDITVDTAAVGWRGKVGVVPELLQSASFEPLCTTALVVGPEIMMRYTLEALRERGVRDEQIYVSLERNMQCGLGHCGHCQLGPTLICRDGPIYPASEVAPLLGVREL